MSGQLYAPTALPPVPSYRSLVGPQSQSGQREEEKIIVPTGNRTPVASRYTDYVITAPFYSPVIHPQCCGSQAPPSKLKSLVTVMLNYIYAERDS
jgi:hypothetical protein